MQAFKKKSTAILCMALMIAGSTLIQARGDLLKVLQSTERFFLIDEGDGFSIQGTLESKMEFSNELANKFAIRFLDSGSAEIQNVNAAVEALRNAETPEDKYACSTQLDQANSILIGVLNQAAMDTDSERELNRFYANLQNCNDQISHSQYNEQARDAAEEISGFPADFFRGLFSIQLPELYQ